jgi:hypothetical protein
VLLLKRGAVVAKRGNNMRPVVLPALQGKGPVRQRSIFAVLTFGSFCQEKEHQFAVEGCLRHLAFRIARNFTRDDKATLLTANLKP